MKKVIQKQFNLKLPKDWVYQVCSYIKPTWKK